MASSLLEADPLTIAKQLTRMEADLFKKATPAEFVRRIIHAQIPTGDANDITPIINLSGKVGELILILTLCGRLMPVADILDCIMGGREYLGVRRC